MSGLAALLVACAPDPGPPDVLLVTIDTARADRFGFMGGPQAAPTPVLDAVAAEGTVFTDAIAPAPITLVSHASLLTGTSPPRHGVRNNGTYVLEGAHTTLAEVLSGQGYQTAAFVAAQVLDSRYGLAQGFDTYDDRIPSSSDLGVVRGRPCDDVVDAALGWLDSAGPEPLFAWVHLFDPHAPYDPPERERALLPGRPYEAEIASADRCVGRLLQGRLQGAVQVITSDHGESLGEHGEASHGVFVYDATQHVPLVLRGPGVPVARVDQQVQLQDVAPTILALADAPPLAEAQGTDLRGTWTGERQAAPAYLESLLSSESYGFSPVFGLRHGGSKLVVHSRSELYDLGSDPGEQRDLAGDRTDRVAELTALLEEVEPTHGAPVEAPGVLDEQTRAELAALGYVWVGSPDLPPVDPHEGLKRLAVVEQARALAGADRHAQALAVLEPVLPHLPGNPTALQLHAHLLVKLRRVDDALAVYAELRARAPRQVQGYVPPAQLLLAEGRGEEAVDVLQEGGDDPAIALTLAEVQARLGAVDEAQATVQRVAPVLRSAARGPATAGDARHDPSRTDHGQRLGRVAGAAWESGAFGLAAECWALAAELVPTDARLHYNRGLALERAGRRSEARAAHGRAVELDPGLVQARRHLEAL